MSEATATQTKAQWMACNIQNKMHQVNVFTRHQISNDYKVSVTESRLPSAGFPITLLM